MLKLVAALLALSLCALAQNQAPTYIAFKVTTLSTTAETVTVQQPATGAKRVLLKSASIYCEEACVVTFKRSGTAATTTALAVIPQSVSFPAATATAFSASNVGSGTTLYQHSIGATSTEVFDLEGIELSGRSTASNFSVSTNTISGEVRIQIVWREQ